MYVEDALLQVRQDRVQQNKVPLVKEWKLAGKVQSLGSPGIVCDSQRSLAQQSSSQTFPSIPTTPAGHGASQAILARSPLHPTLSYSYSQPPPAESHQAYNRWLYNQLKLYVPRTSKPVDNGKSMAISSQSFAEKKPPQLLPPVSSSSSSSSLVPSSTILPITFVSDNASNSVHRVTSDSSTASATIVSPPSKPKSILSRDPKTAPRSAASHAPNNTATDLPSDTNTVTSALVSVESNPAALSQASSNLLPSPKKSVSFSPAGPTALGDPFELDSTAQYSDHGYEQEDNHDAGDSSDSEGIENAVRSYLPSVTTITQESFDGDTDDEGGDDPFRTQQTEAESKRSMHLNQQLLKKARAKLGGMLKSDVTSALNVWYRNHASNYKKKVSKKQRERCWMVFNILDEDRSGTVELDEVQCVCGCYRVYPLVDRLCVDLWPARVW